MFSKIKFSTSLLVVLLVTSQPLLGTDPKKDFAVFVAAGVIIAGVAGAIIGYLSNSAIAENQKRQLVTDVQNIAPENEFSELFDLIRHARINHSDPIDAVADAYTNNALKIRVEQIEEYNKKSINAYKNLEKQVTLWKNDSSINQQLLKTALTLTEGNQYEEVQEKLNRIKKLACDMRQLKPYFEAYAYFNNVKNKSYNHDGKQFALVYAVKEMQTTCEKLREYKKELLVALNNAVEHTERYQDLIQAINTYANNLADSIVQARNSSEYKDQLKHKELRDERDRLIKIQEQNVKNEQDKVTCQLMEQKGYKRRLERAEERNEKLVKEKNEYIEKLEQEKKKNRELLEKIRKLERQASELQQQIDMLKKSGTQDALLLKNKELELSDLQERINLLKRKINEKRFPFNPHAEDSPVNLANWLVTQIGNL